MAFGSRHIRSWGSGGVQWVQACPIASELAIWCPVLTPMQQGDRPDGNEWSKEEGRKEGRREGGREEGRKEGVAPLLNLGDPHLAGGEQNNQFFLSFWCVSVFFGGCWLSYFVVVLGFLVCVFLVCSDGFDFPCCFSTFCRKPPYTCCWTLKTRRQHGPEDRRREERRR